MKLKWGDAFLIVIFIVLAVIPFWAMKPSEGNAVAVISQDGKVIQRIHLSQVTDEQHLTIKGDYTNIITMSNGSISFTSSDCPDKVCVHSGMISKPGQTAVCLPNRVEIRIEGEGNVDAVSG